LEIYEVATTGLPPADVAGPIRSIFRSRRNVAVHLARVRAINVAEKWIATERIRLRFDYLVLACDARSGYLGHGEWEEHAPSNSSRRARR
jgi:NADH:quinone reductase (non-electrogenic)